MFKLVVLSALLVVAAARPSLIGSPIVYSAPAFAQTVAVHEPALAKVGSIVKSVPTSISHQSQSIVHSSANVVEDVIAPVVKSTPVVTYAAAPAPIVHTYAAVASPWEHATYAGAPLLKTIPSPLIYGSAW